MSLRDEIQSDRKLPAQCQYTLQTQERRGCCLTATAWLSGNTAAHTQKQKRQKTG